MDQKNERQQRQKPGQAARGADPLDPVRADRLENVFQHRKPGNLTQAQARIMLAEEFQLVSVRGGQERFVHAGGEPDRRGVRI